MPRRLQAIMRLCTKIWTPRPDAILPMSESGYPMNVTYRARGEAAGRLLPKVMYRSYLPMIGDKIGLFIDGQRVPVIVIRMQSYGPTASGGRRPADLHVEEI